MKNSLFYTTNALIKAVFFWHPLCYYIIEHATNTTTNKRKEKTMRDAFDIFDRMFGTLDAAFRDIERDFRCPNRLPVITLPAIRTSRVDRRTYHDGEKTISYQNGLVHNDTGPAIIYDDDREDEYYLNGIKSTKEEVESLKQKLEDEREHSVWVDGKEYKVSGKRLRELGLEDKLREK